MTKHINRLGAIALALAVGGLALPSVANAFVRPTNGGSHGTGHFQSPSHGSYGNHYAGRGGYNRGYGGYNGGYGGYGGGVYYGGFCGPIQIALGACSPYGY